MKLCIWRKSSLFFQLDRPILNLFVVNLHKKAILPYRIQVPAITVLYTCIINKKSITFVKINFNLLVLLSSWWKKKSTRNLLEGMTATIKINWYFFFWSLKYKPYHLSLFLVRASLLVDFSSDILARVPCAKYPCVPFTW